jgi:iron complex outermembrane receptor protein
MKKTNIAFLFVWILISARLSAQEPVPSDTTVELAQVVVAYRADKKTPITFQNLDAAYLQSRYIGQEPSFLLAETPSITNYSDAGGTQGYSYFRIRGIDQTRINITLDGVPLNDPEDQGAYFSNYPDILNSVGNIQIQRGVGTTKNGSASYGGSVQLFSPNLTDSARATFGFGYGSFNTLRAFAEYQSGVRKGRSIYVRASQVYSDGYKNHSSNNSQSLFVSGAWFREKSTWKFNLLAGNQRNGLAWIGVADSLIGLDRKTNANSAQEKDRFLQCLAQVRNDWQIGRFSSLQSSVYYTFLDGNYGFDLNNFLGLPSTDELFNYAFRSHLIGGYSNFGFSQKNFGTTVGIHGNHCSRRHLGSEKALGELYRNTGLKDEVSVFAKASYTLRWLTAFLDLQFRTVRFEYRGSVPMETLHWSFFNPRFGLSAALNKDWTLYYGIGKTGREPTRNDMFAGNDDLPADSLGNALLANTDPEFVLDHELGVHFGGERIGFDLNAYFMDFQNEIVLDGKFGPNGLALSNNVEKSIRTGLELSIRCRLNRYFSLTNQSSWNYSRITEQSVQFSPILTPALIVNQEVAFASERFSAALSLRYQHRSYIDFANSAEINGYLLLNVRAGFRFKGFQLALFANNLTNARYFNNGYVDFDGRAKYFVQSPINFFASIEYSIR